MTLYLHPSIHLVPCCDQILLQDIVCVPCYGLRALNNPGAVTRFWSVERSAKCHLRGWCTCRRRWRPCSGPPPATPATPPAPRPRPPPPTYFQTAEVWRNSEFRIKNSEKLWISICSNACLRGEVYLSSQFPASDQNTAHYILIIFHLLANWDDASRTKYAPMGRWRTMNILVDIVDIFSRYI